MRIEDLASENGRGAARIRATVVWEDCNRPSEEVYFETPEEFADDLSCHPHPFLVGSVMPAMRHGERRIFVDGAICPELREGLTTAMEVVRGWYRLDGEAPRIEAENAFSVLSPGKPHREAVFFTGGIDSLTALRLNRLRYPPPHPGWIEDALIVLGLGDFYDEERVLELGSNIAADARLTILPVRTNLRHVVDDWVFWVDHFEGAVLASVAHALARRLSTVNIASTYDIPRLHPHASHPLLDPCYGSSDLRIRHIDFRLSRFEKVKVLADWEAGLQNLRPCVRPWLTPPGALNCGQCEKCVRTMLALLAAGKLHKTQVFPRNDVTSADVAKSVYLGSAIFYPELLQPLADAGREDLVRAIEYQIDMLLIPVPWWKRAIARADRKLLGGTITGLMRLLRRLKRAMARADRKLLGGTITGLKRFLRRLDRSRRRISDRRPGEDTDLSAALMRQRQAAIMRQRQMEVSE
jgi:hypothetical protein